MLEVGKASTQGQANYIYCFASAIYLIYVRTDSHYLLFVTLCTLSTSMVQQPLKASMSCLEGNLDNYS